MKKDQMGDDVGNKCLASCRDPVQACFIVLMVLPLCSNYSSGKPRLTLVANSASGIYAAGLGRVEVSYSSGGEQKETLALIKVHTF